MRWGSPTITPLERLVRSCEENKATGCIEWQGHTVKGGYGRFYFNGRTQGAHRAAWLLMLGPIPEGMQVCHHCDNPPCCNPMHLFLGTVKDNAQDKARKGRATKPQLFMRNVRAKLTDEQVAEIRATRGAISNKEWAVRLGMDDSVICRLRKGETYRRTQAEMANMRAHR